MLPSAQPATCLQGALVRPGWHRIINQVQAQKAPPLQLMRPLCGGFSGFDDFQQLRKDPDLANIQGGELEAAIRK